MKKIWKILLHANIRCGRMCKGRAEPLAESILMPSGARMCAPGSKETF